GDAARVHLTCIAFVRGFVLHEHAWLPGGDERVDVGDARGRTSENRDAPATSPAAAVTTRPAEPFDAEQFHFSLDLLLHGVRAKLEQSMSPGDRSVRAKRAATGEQQ